MAIWRKIGFKESPIAESILNPITGGGQANLPYHACFSKIIVKSLFFRSDFFLLLIIYIDATFLKIWVETDQPKGNGGLI